MEVLIAAPTGTPEVTKVLPLRRISSLSSPQLDNINNVAFREAR